MSAPPAGLAPGAPPRRVAVIGAGFAGLACATALAEAGRQVVVLESRRQAGGRAGSFLDEASGETLDNGQHLFMSCYAETRRFLRRIGTEGLIRFQRRLKVDYLHRGRLVRLSCPALPAPWHLLAAVLALKGPSLPDRLALLRAGPAIRRLRAGGAAAGLAGMTVSEWLDRLGQPEGIRRWLWHPLAIATLNESPDRAPASLLAAVIREAFLASPSASALGLATVGLGDLYVPASRAYLERRGGSLTVGRPAARLVLDGARVTAVQTREGDLVEADAFVSSVPPSALLRLGVPLQGLERFETSPILSVNLWFDRPLSGLADFDFAGIVGGRIQWLFNKQRILQGGASHLAAVVSSARDLVTRTNEQLVELTMEDLREHLPALGGATLTRAIVVRERSATFSASVQTEPLRPGPGSPCSNLLLAGDWTVPGWPPTIEAAVLSGHRCARMLAGDAAGSMQTARGAGREAS